VGKGIYDDNPTRKKWRWESNPTSKISQVSAMTNQRARTSTSTATHHTIRDTGAIGMHTAPTTPGGEGTLMQWINGLVDDDDSPSVEMDIRHIAKWVKHYSNG
jgi:hypothetical protein